MCTKKQKDKLETKGNDDLQGWMEMVQGIDKSGISPTKKGGGFLRKYLFIQFYF